MSTLMLSGFSISRTAVRCARAWPPDGRVDRDVEAVRKARFRQQLLGGGQVRLADLEVVVVERCPGGSSCASGAVTEERQPTIAGLSMAIEMARRTRGLSSGLCAPFMMMPSHVDVGTESITRFGFFLNCSMDSSGRFQTRSTSPVSMAADWAALSGMIRMITWSSCGTPLT
jgi:hypothetical protein